MAQNRGDTSEEHSDELDAAWVRYRTDGDARARETLILHYAPLVKFVAMRVAARLPHSIESAEVTQLGFVGLIDAVERFDPDRNVPFRFYATWRIEGAILDELRRLDWVPRSVRVAVRHLDEARSDLRHRLKREPDASELADALNLPVDVIEETEHDAVRTQLVSLDGAAQSPTVHRALTDERTAHLDTSGEQLARIIDAMASVPPRERRVLALRYEQGKTLTAIGEILHVSESRVCQIHTQAIRRLRAMLQIEPSTWDLDRAPERVSA